MSKLGVFKRMRLIFLSATRNGFTTKQRDVETGWDYFGARYYNPALARWMAVDPKAEDANQIHLTPYNYAWNRPNMVVDPDGQCPWCIGFVVGLFLGADVIDRNGTSSTDPRANARTRERVTQWENTTAAVELLRGNPLRMGGKYIPYIINHSIRSN
jgi:RHS repeat-associated protein